MMVEIDGFSFSSLLTFLSLLIYTYRSLSLKFISSLRLSFSFAYAPSLHFFFSFSCAEHLLLFDFFVFFGFLPIFFCSGWCSGVAVPVFLWLYICGSIPEITLHLPMHHGGGGERGANQRSVSCSWSPIFFRSVVDSPL